MNLFLKVVLNDIRGVYTKNGRIKPTPSSKDLLEKVINTQPVKKIITFY
jgi:hypothetical protein